MTLPQPHQGIRDREQRVQDLLGVRDLVQHFQLMLLVSLLACRNRVREGRSNGVGDGWERVRSRDEGPDCWSEFITEG